MAITQTKPTFYGLSNELPISDFLERNEAGDADLFERLYSGRVAYDHQAGEWYFWRGNFWEADKKRDIYQTVFDGVANAYLDKARTETSSAKKDYLDRARYLLTKKRADSVLYLAAGKEKIGITGNEWDIDPLILGVNNGVIDLRSGLFRMGQPSEYIRSHTPVDWQGLDAPAPEWEKALADIFGNDAEMLAFIQRLFGYAITGETSERVLPILWGEGANGKSTLLETIAGILGGDICMTTQADSLMDTRRAGDAPQPFVYALRGKRLAYAQESKEGQKINTGLVKQLTGGDSIRTRTLFQKTPLEFKPTHKVMLITNHKPHIPADDQAAWDRVLLVEFRTRFFDNPTAPHERSKDKNLKTKLLAEAPGILAWLVRGSLAWQQDGLNPPAMVRNATQAYRDGEDNIGLFLEECCIADPGRKSKAADLYTAYDTWVKMYNSDAVGLSAFGKYMTARFESKKTKEGKFYFGIGILVKK